jgi:endonuclease V-like protein UPF0215 family
VKRPRPHVLGVDDGPFDKRRRAPVPIVGVMTEGHDLVEGIAATAFPPDGEDVTAFLGQWITGLRLARALHAVVLGGISIAGLGLVEIERLAAALGRAVIVVNRRDPRDERLRAALEAAGLGERGAVIDATPRAWQLDAGLWVAHAGASQDEVRALVAATRHKSQLPEPLRLAHLVAAAIARGESRGRP